MTELRSLKKKLSKLKHHRSHLPRLIDCSEMYGDGYYTKEDLESVNNQISKLEEEIKNLKG